MHQPDFGMEGEVAASHKLGLRAGDQTGFKTEAGGALIERGWGRRGIAQKKRETGTVFNLGKIR